MAFNVVSSIAALYGLLVARKVLGNILKNYRITGKVALIKLCVVVSVVPGVITSILATNDKIQCNAIFSLTDNTARIKQCVQVFIMLPLAFLANVFYRHESDGAADKICLDEFPNANIVNAKNKESEAEPNDVIETFNEANEVPLVVKTAPR